MPKLLEEHVDAAWPVDIDRTPITGRTARSDRVFIIAIASQVGGQRGRHPRGEPTISHAFHRRISLISRAICIVTHAVFVVMPGAWRLSGAGAKCPGLPEAAGMANPLPATYRDDPRPNLRRIVHRRVM
jgi:hypothetical protein